MAAKSKIEWTDSSWTPIRARNRKTGKIGWHYEHATPGCEFCYAETLNQRVGTGLPFKPGHRADVEIFLDEKMLTAPLRWRQPRMIFVCSMTDLFADFVTDEWIDRVFAVMTLCPQHIFQVLTKRSGRMREYFHATRQLHIADSAIKIGRNLPQGHPGWDTGNWIVSSRSTAKPAIWPLPNVWLGVSPEDQRRADERVPDLRATPAAVRFVSGEPLLGPIDFRQWLHDYGCGCGWGGVPLDYCNNCGWRGDAPTIAVGSGEHVGACPGCGEELSDYNACPECDGHDGDGTSFGPNSLPRLDWIIVGGESGRHARPMHPDWARSIRDQCAAAGVPFFFKQWGDFLFNDGGQWMRRVGKRNAGRLLDGVKHNEFPRSL